ncbi:MAG: hypothetical protein KDE27_12305 [Planctomycetes bacterium]|nr:hypothetical protein [Planctomycetota bacterium]
MTSRHVHFPTANIRTAAGGGEAVVVWVESDPGLATTLGVGPLWFRTL